MESRARPILVRRTRGLIRMLRVGRWSRVVRHNAIAMLDCGFERMLQGSVLFHFLRRCNVSYRTGMDVQLLHLSYVTAALLLSDRSSDSGVIGMQEIGPNNSGHERLPFADFQSAYQCLNNFMTWIINEKVVTTNNTATLV
ncbi:hypothetical protein BD410DRAFT_178942 [Rickenella mellea]|uniref:Uncharacterized protein n=1 Tax=Rickenella mellea TaxID=50990 RepID=A0A4Y7Q705_9AGAM|nr:hypothetical protein BD410DRAFT_178942 [Rickenella mellea]